MKKRKSPILLISLLVIFVGSGVVYSLANMPKSATPQQDPDAQSKVFDPTATHENTNAQQMADAMKQLPKGTANAAAPKPMPRRPDSALPTPTPATVQPQQNMPKPKPNRAGGTSSQWYR